MTSGQQAQGAGESIETAGNCDAGDGTVPSGAYDRTVATTAKRHKTAILVVNKSDQLHKSGPSDSFERSVLQYCHWQRL
jgi:hypothetical protein